MSSAVVLPSTATGLSSGTGGGFTVAHSAMMSPARAEEPANAAANTAAIMAAQQAKSRASPIFSSRRMPAIPVLRALFDDIPAIGATAAPA